MIWKELYDQTVLYKVCINENEDKKIFVVPLTHTLKEDIEREVMMIMMTTAMINMMMASRDNDEGDDNDGVIPSHVILFCTMLFRTACKQIKFLTGIYWIR